MILVTITISNGYFNLSNTHNTIESRKFVPKAFMCTLGI